MSDFTANGHPGDCFTNMHDGRCTMLGARREEGRGKERERERRRCGVSPEVLSRSTKESRVLFPPTKLFLSHEEARDRVPGHLEMMTGLASPPFISVYLGAFPDDRSPTAYSTRFRIVVCGRSTSPKKTFSSRGERLAPPYAPPVPLHALHRWYPCGGFVCPLLRSSFFYYMPVVYTDGGRTQVCARVWVHTCLYVCQM